MSETDPEHRVIITASFARSCSRNLHLLFGRIGVIVTACFAIDATR